MSKLSTDPSDRQRDRRDQNYTPRRFVGVQKLRSLPPELYKKTLNEIWKEK